MIILYVLRDLIGVMCAICGIAAVLGLICYCAYNVVKQFKLRSVRYLLIGFLFCAHVASAAVGDLIGLEVETNGFVLRATIAGLNTNGAFYSGLATNNTPGTEKLKLSITTPGFDSVGVSNLNGDVSIATTNLWLPWPSSGTNDYQAQGDDVVIRLALSRKINTNETVTATALAGYYAVTNGTGTNASAFTSQTVTNNSTNVWSKVIAGWANPGFQVITGSTYRISVVAFQEHARNGQPVAAVRFWNEDSAGNRTTTLVSRASVAADGVVEFVATMDASTMTQSAIVTNNFIAYPWVGTTPHVSADYNARGTNAYHYSVVGSCFYLCDKSGTYGTSVAAVDPVNGSSSGKVLTNIHFSASAPPAPFATIGQANNAIAASNNAWYGRNDAGTGVIYITNGIHTWTGTATTGNKPVTWVTVSGWPGSDRSTCIISNQATDANLSEFVKIQSLTITNAAATFTILDNFWADDVVFNPANPGAQTMNIITNCWITNSKIRGGGAANNGSGLWKVRGCEMDPATTVTYAAQLFIGNYQTTSTPNAFSYAIRTANARPGPVSIFAFNRLYCQTNNSTRNISFEFPTTTQYAPDYIGAAFVQNIVEAIRDNVGALALASDVSSSNLQNFLCWNNTTPGQKVNWFYSWDTTGTGHKSLTCSSSILNNVWEEYNIKSDDNAGGANGNNIGNWGVLYGAGSEGNFFPEVYNIGVPGGFLFRFFGLNTWGQTSLVGTNTITRFTDRRAYAVTNDFGNGNYRLLSDSPAFRRINTRWVLPFDIEGKPRGQFDPPGAYTAGNVKKGAFF